MNYDSLDALIEMCHACKWDGDSEEFRQHITDVAWKNAKDNTDPIELAIDYGCAIYSKLLASYLKFDKEHEFNYLDDSCTITRKAQ